MEDKTVKKVTKKQNVKPKKKINKSALAGNKNGFGKPRRYTPEELDIASLQYIEEKGFYTDTLSFTKDGDKNQDKRYVIVTNIGFMDWLNTNLDYLYQLNKEDYSSSLTRIEERFLNHNIIGGSLGHIDNRILNLYLKNKNKFKENPDMTEIARERLEFDKSKVVAENEALKEEVSTIRDLLLKDNKE